MRLRSKQEKMRTDCHAYLALVWQVNPAKCRSFCSPFNINGGTLNSKPNIIYFKISDSRPQHQRQKFCSSGAISSTLDISTPMPASAPTDFYRLRAPVTHSVFLTSFEPYRFHYKSNIKKLLFFYFFFFSNLKLLSKHAWHIHFLLNVPENFIGKFLRTKISWHLRARQQNW